MLTQSLTDIVSKTTEVLHIYADGVLGNDANDGLEKSSGTGGSFSIAAGTVTFTGTGAAWTSSDVGRLVTIYSATSSNNNGSFRIVTVPASNQITYANALGVTEAFTGSWTVASPKLTLQAVLDLVPAQIENNVAVHLSGTFGLTLGALGNGATIVRNIKKSITCLIDGGMGMTVVAGVPWTADINSVTSIGLTTAGWAQDAYRGYMVEILSGAAVGQTRLIATNDATTITPTVNFSVDPGAGALFRVVRPTTTLNGTASNTDLLVGLLGAGNIYCQSLYFTGGCAYIGTGGSGNNLLKSCVINSTAAFPFKFTDCSGVFGCDCYYINPRTFVQSGFAAPCAGVGVVAPAAVPGVLVSSMGLATLRGYVGGWAECSAISGGLQITGCRIDGLTIWGCKGLPEVLPGPTTPGIFNTTGMMPTTITGLFSGTLPGIMICQSDVEIGDDVIVQDGYYGIEAVNSQIILDEVIGINTNAGVYAHSGSKIFLRTGQTPLITGASFGDLSTDGVIQNSTWVAIAGGTPAYDTDEGVQAKIWDPWTF